MRTFHARTVRTLRFAHPTVFDADSASRCYFPRCLSKNCAISVKASFVSGAYGVEIILGVRHALVDLQIGLDAGLAQLAVREHRWLRNRSRVPLVRIAGGKPWKSP